MTTTTANAVGKGWFSFDFVGGTAYSSHPIASVLNPEGASVLVTDAIVYFGVTSTGSANVNIGLGTSATGDYYDMAGTIDVSDVAGKFYTCRAKSASAQTEITAPGVWLSTEYCNITGDASTEGLTGTMYIQYLRLD
jgi:hypothetical protein